MTMRYEKKIAGMTQQAKRTNKSFPEGKKARSAFPVDAIYQLHKKVGNKAVQLLLSSNKVNTETLQCTPFPGETPEREQRRKDAISGIQNAIRRVEEGLHKGYLWPFETLQGTNILIDKTTLETQKERNARLSRLIDDLWSLVTKLQGKPIPKKWLKSNVYNEGWIQYDIVYPNNEKSTFACEESDPFCSDVDLFYEYYTLLSHNLIE